MTQRKQILVVEDERIVAMALQQTLSELGYEALNSVATADEAIASASERCPDLVLMDIRIKGARDGIETAELLRRQFGVPVVFLTAHSDDDTIARATRAEPFGYLLKPVKSGELRSSIEISLFRHHMERRLRERERWFSTTLTSIADAVIAVDPTGRVTFMNPAAEHLTGVSAEAALGRPAGEVLRLDAMKGISDADTPLGAALRAGAPVQLLEASLLNQASGARRQIADSAAPVLDNAETLGAVMVFRDVTDQNALQKRLELADRLASLGTMAAGVAHEVNNPLAAVVANAAIVEEAVREVRGMLHGGTVAEAPTRLDEATDALKDLQSAASRIRRIVSDLKAFSRPADDSSGRTDVIRCIEWALRTTSHEFHHRARVVTHFDPTPAIAADETRLGQIVVNLLINAAHAITPGNADRNAVTITTHTDGQGRAVIQVADTGSGIPENVRGAIFEPFFTTKPVGSGTGLGLSIVHGIVKSLGGEIELDTEVGKGTTFRVLLPPAVVPLPAPEPAEAPADRPVRRGRILVVDDEVIVLKAITRILRHHDVVAVERAQDGLALIDAGEHFDLVVSDIMLPTMTGIEFYEALLARHPDVARRMAFLSGGALTARIEDFLGSVPNRRIEKPFEAADLRRRVQALLGEHQQPH